MRRIAWVLAIWPGIVAAQDWQGLSGDAVRVALESRRLVYENGACYGVEITGGALRFIGASGEVTGVAFAE